MKEHKHYSDKPLRENRKDINYADLANAEEEDSSLKCQKRIPKVPSEPSKECIAAQQEIISNDKPKGKPAAPKLGVHRHFTTKDPVRANLHIDGRMHLKQIKEVNHPQHR